jgi:adenylosuccinate synthase
MIDLIKPKAFEDRLKTKIKENNEILKAFGARALSFAKVHETYRRAAEKLAPYVANTVIYLHTANRRGKDILFEGAQGTFLDIDHGTYPFVTSSEHHCGGRLHRFGHSPASHGPRRRRDESLYHARRVRGPLPTENSEIADMLHSMGREFGATTGRARRCGWFDAVATRHATMVNGIDDLAVTNVDGLDTLDNIRVCVAYRVGKQQFDYVPNDIDLLSRCEPVYIDFVGWKTPTTNARKWKDLPPRARTYLEALAEVTGARLSIVSVGPAREQTIFV